MSWVRTICGKSSRRCSCPGLRSPADARLLFALALPRVSLAFTLLLVFTTVCWVTLGIGLTVASGVLVGAVPAATRGGLDSPAGGRLLAALAVVAILFWLRQALEPFQSLPIDVLGRRFGGHIRVRAMRASLSPTGIAHLEDPALRDLLSRARGALTGQYTPEMTVRGLHNLLLKVLQSAASTALIGIYYRWWLALGLLAVLLAIRVRIRRQVLQTLEVMMSATPAIRRADYFLDLALDPQAAKETRVFGLADWVVERFQSAWVGSMRPVWAERRERTRSAAPWAVAVVFAALLAAFCLVSWDAARGRIGLAALTVVVQSIATLASFLFSINLPELWLEYGATAVPAVRALEETTHGRAPRGRAPTGGMPRDAIRFERVSFRYPHSEREIYSGLDLELPAGRSVAIVGANGAGKTTLVKLLCRLHEPTSGRITADGVDLRELAPGYWRSRIAVIFQDFVRYELTAADNVGFGAPALAGDRDALERAVRRAGARDIVAGLPRGWDTILSGRYEGGTDLSGGQWQRIALARALFAVEAGASILVLDEPTASLDVRAEAALFERFLELTRGLTTVLISHRFSTVRRADLIYVLEGGSVAERGSHEELLARDGVYARLFRLQAARFVEETGTDG
jgi:ATP-binding cassette subfamily B protein